MSRPIFARYGGGVDHVAVHKELPHELLSKPRRRRALEPRVCRVDGAADCQIRRFALRRGVNRARLDRMHRRRRAEVAAAEDEPRAAVRRQLVHAAAVCARGVVHLRSCRSPHVRIGRLPVDDGVHLSRQQWPR